MFEDIMKNKQKNIVYTNATIVVNGKKYDVRAYNIDMTAGTIVGFIEDITRKIDGYTDYEISIPIGGTNCEWSFPIMVVRTSPNTLKFYSPGAE
jgi:hypothetical protein